MPEGNYSLFSTRQKELRNCELKIDFPGLLLDVSIKPGSDRRCRFRTTHSCGMALNRNSVQDWAHLTTWGSELGSPKAMELAGGSSSPVMPASEDGDKESRSKLPRETSHISELWA